MNTTTKAAELLRSYPFVVEDGSWTFTPDSELTALRYSHKRDRLRSRIKEAWGWLIHPPAFAKELGSFGLLGRWRMFLHCLHLDPHLPDGTLDGGNIITIWAETGEYLQLVQPSVGEKIADVIAAHPDLPEVKALADEIMRVAGVASNG